MTIPKQNITIIAEIDPNHYPVSYARKPKCCTMCCLSFVATLFFLIGLFQTIVALAFVEAGRRNPILVMGPMFMAIGGLLYMGVFEMCRTRRRMKREALNGGPPNEAEDEGNLHMNTGNTIVIRADQLPPYLTLNAEDLQHMSVDEKRRLLAAPSLPPVDICSPAPAYYTGCARLPQSPNYSPPEGGVPINVVGMGNPEELVLQAQEQAQAPKDGDSTEISNREESPNAQKAQQDISEALTKILLVSDTPAVQ